jgi:hypothetical protein
MNKYLAFYINCLVKGRERYLYKIQLSTSQLILTSQIKNFRLGDVHSTVHEPIGDKYLRNIHTKSKENKYLANYYVDPKSQFNFIIHHHMRFKIDEIINLPVFQRKYADKVCIDVENLLKINNIYFFTGDIANLVENIKKVGRKLGVPHEIWVFEHKNKDIARSVGFIAIKHPNFEIFPIPEDDSVMEKMLHRRNFDFTVTAEQINPDGSIGQSTRFINVTQIERLQSKRTKNSQPT